MVIVAPLLGGTLENLPIALSSAVGRAALFVGIAIALGLWVLPWLMGRVAGIRSRELFLLTVLVLCLGAAVGTYIFGLSVVFGAFIIGLVLRESRFAQQALAEITPLRDIFATLFFISLGMLLNPGFLIDQWSSVAVLVAIIIVLKFLVVFGIIRLFGYSGRIAFLAGAGLFQIGEFSFLLAQAGMNMGIISEQLYSLIIASAIITMILTPLSVSLAAWLYPKLVPAPSELVGEGASALSVSGPSEAPNPVVIAGYGRVGQNITQGLQDAGVPCTVIEIDPELTSKLRYKGIACIYGDASNAHILARVGLEKAKALVITFPDPLAVVTTVQNALRINPKLKVVARVHRAKEAESLKRLGVKEVVSPEYEASLEFLEKILSVSGWSKADVRRTLAALRQAKATAEFSSDEEQ
jgi:CPA2 family monovalent cation:H+ antiporter-2